MASHKINESKKSQGCFLIYAEKEFLKDKSLMWLSCTKPYLYRLENGFLLKEAIIFPIAWPIQLTLIIVMTLLKVF